MIARSIALALFGIAAWNVVFWRKVNGAAVPNRAAAPGDTTVLIPARDEEDRLPACLESLRDQQAEGIFIYDDHSSDGTSAVIERFAREDPRIRRISPLPLPAGWGGKNFACWQLAASANSKWLLFLDADVRLAPDAIARMTAEAERLSVTLLSCWPGIEMHGFWEAALMPMLNFLVFTLFPAPFATVCGHPSLRIAHGACILVRRETYKRLGGHALVRKEIFEDTRLAQEWRARGERSLCLDGQDMVHVRMYSDFAEIWQGFGKNFYPAFRHKRNFWLFLAVHGWIFLWPFFRRDRRVMALTLATRALLAARFRQPVAQEWWSVALHPLGEFVLIAIALNSWWQCRGGRGMVWKGRLLPV